MRTYSKSIAAAIDAYLSAKKWHYHFDDQDGVFRFSLCLTGLIKKLEYVIIVHEFAYLVLVIVNDVIIYLTKWDGSCFIKAHSFVPEKRSLVYQLTSGLRPQLTAELFPIHRLP